MPSLVPLLADSSSNLLAARSQMGFTLGFHIVLACLGVAFPAMMLVAEWQGHRKKDQEALRLARNWSKAVAVLFAVGAVTGTVLSFEFGLLWPRFTGRFGDAFGIALRNRGDLLLPGGDLHRHLHLRLGPPLATGTHVGCGADRDLGRRRRLLRDRRQRLDEPATGLRARLRRQRHQREAVRSALQPGDRLRVLPHVPRGLHRHRLSHRLRVRGRDAPWQPWPLQPARLRDPIHVRRRSPRRFSSSSGTRRRAPSPTTSRPSSRRWSAFTREGRTRPSTSAVAASTVRSRVGSGSRGSTRFWSGSARTPTSPVSTRSPRTTSRPPSRCCTCRSISWLGSPPDSSCLQFGSRSPGGGGVTCRPRVGSCGSAPSPGWRPCVALWCGWIVTEVGRQPWIVNGYMRTADAVTPAQGIWWVFGVTLALYVALGVIAVVVLRALSRRWQAGQGDAELPYSPPPEVPPTEASA